MLYYTMQQLNLSATKGVATTTVVILIVGYVRGKLKTTKYQMKYDGGDYCVG